MEITPTTPAKRATGLSEHSGDPGAKTRRTYHTTHEICGKHEVMQIYHWWTEVLQTPSCRQQLANWERGPGEEVVVEEGDHEVLVSPGTQLSHA